MLEPNVLAFPSSFSGQNVSAFPSSLHGCRCLCFGLCIDDLSLTHAIFELISEGVGAPIIRSEAAISRRFFAQGNVVRVPCGHYTPSIYRCVFSPYFTNHVCTRYFDRVCVHKMVPGIREHNRHLRRTLVFVRPIGNTG